MASERNRVTRLAEYITSLGVIVNIGKNKARGNKGIFCKKRDGYRIDISENIDADSTLSTLLHEFAHYIHYCNDSTLSSLDFVFKDLSELEQEELIKITVQNVPKEFASSLDKCKQHYMLENKKLVSYIKAVYPNFKVSEPFKPIERLLKYPVKYLLKYDKIQVLTQIYAIDTLENDFKTLTEEQIAYIRLKSNQRQLARINSKINRLNKYYNQSSELWARFFELFFTNREAVEKLAPSISARFLNFINNKTVKEIEAVDAILNS